MVFAPYSVQSNFIQNEHILLHIVGSYLHLHLEKCHEGSEGPPADLKFIHLFAYFSKNYENRTLGTPDILV